MPKKHFVPIEKIVDSEIYLYYLITKDTLNWDLTDINNKNLFIYKDNKPVLVSFLWTLIAKLKLNRDLDTLFDLKEDIKIDDMSNDNLDKCLSYLDLLLKNIDLYLQVFTLAPYIIFDSNDINATSKQEIKELVVNSKREIKELLAKIFKIKQKAIKEQQYVNLLLENPNKNLVFHKNNWLVLKDGTPILRNLFRNLKYQFCRLFSTHLFYNNYRTFTNDYYTLLINESDVSNPNLSLMALCFNIDANIIKKDLFNDVWFINKFTMYKYLDSVNNDIDEAIFKPFNIGGGRMNVYDTMGTLLPYFSVGWTGEPIIEITKMAIDNVDLYKTPLINDDKRQWIKFINDVANNKTSYFILKAIKTEIPQILPITNENLKNAVSNTLQYLKFEEAEDYKNFQKVLDDNEQFLSSKYNKDEKQNEKMQIRR